MASFRILMALILMLTTLCLAYDSVSDVSHQISIADQNYFIPPKASWRLTKTQRKLVKSDEDWIPMTVVGLNETFVNGGTIGSRLGHFHLADDVWTPDFASMLVVLNRSVPKLHLITSLLPDYKVDLIVSEQRKIPEGPYVLNQEKGEVHQVYKLLPDDSQAFIQTSYQGDDYVHYPLPAGVQSAGGLTIAIPSRLYFNKTEDQPLAGLRVAVSDVFHLNGMKTSAGNRAYFEMSDIQNVTALAVQRLITAGAIVIGKTKVSEFSVSGSSVPESLDYLVPSNPRGDGYNSPGDGSSGSAAAIASYVWLDIAVGTDTGGEVRAPALGNGVFGNRPSLNLVDMKGVVPVSPAMDTCGTFARDPLVWSAVNEVMYSRPAYKTHRAFPKTIYLDLDFAASIPLGWVNQTQDFVNQLATLVQGDISWSNPMTTWYFTRPVNETLRTIYDNITAYDQWTRFGKDFVDKYRSTHDGDHPHMAWATRQSWLNADAHMSRKGHMRNMEALQHFHTWSSSKFLEADNDTCSDGIYMYFTAPNDALKHKADVGHDAENPFILDLANARAEQVKNLADNVCKSTGRLPDSVNGELECTRRGSRNSSKAVWTPPTWVDEQMGSLFFASLAGLPDFSIPLGFATVQEQEDRSDSDSDEDHDGPESNCDCNEDDDEDDGNDDGDDDDDSDDDDEKDGDGDETDTDDGDGDKDGDDDDGDDDDDDKDADDDGREIWKTLQEYEDVASNSSLQAQKLPFGVNLVAAAGCDFMLQDLVTELWKKGILASIRTGADGRAGLVEG